ncbi:acetyl CoA synthetase subunit alpha [Candidatus Gottesmanbacteria bacterium RBG_16_52_11]|uniref:Acetyl CoA synthetase subunit alpha n=1 Tax=Candidatus Gottesmanbacteria bacterium RBG_16_52_11 TaxID=1798374 RepID=A0A1F5YXS1_9BACT|nr:MAG: acetyl CoA synthetase subunit alpha [Candidatus Gottesmanbacteria bacterium RBG_16_52_11]
MNQRHLKTLFNPKTVAVIGASNQEGSVGYSLLKNLLGSGFAGTIYPVNNKHDTVQGVRAYPTIADVPDKVDLGIVAVPASAVPGVVEECGKAGNHALVIVSAGFAEAGVKGEQLAKDILDKAREYDVTFLGPNCLGFIRPKARLNASFSRKMANTGGIAFISQSGALCSAVLDWSVKENVGFSYFVSIGETLDIGYHDLIDYFGSDPETTSILIYMESLTEARRFLSAARGFARTKPIIVLKVGKSSEGAKAALSHTGSLTGNNQVYDAAFKRVGILRVGTISELFDCAKTLSMQARPKGNRLAIVTNAGGPGVIATDALVDMKGELASLSPETVSYLDEHLPPHWSHGNPVDVLGDADAIRYRKAVEACLNEPGTDGTLVILTPQAVTDAVAVSKELVQLNTQKHKTILAAWMGEDDVAEGRRILEEGSIPAYEKPEDAVRAFMHMYEYERNLELLYETPGTVPHAFTPATQDNRILITDAVNNGRHVLTEPQAKKLLANYEIPVPKGELVNSAEAAGNAAKRIGFPVVAKIVSPDIIHKFDVGGVVVGITTAGDAAGAYTAIINTVRSKVPHATIDGVYVEQMISKQYELLIGCKKDPIFGPAIVFGMGGIAVEVFKDTNVGLPPLNMALAQRLIEGTTIYRLLKGYRGVAGVNVEAIQYLLYKFAYLVMDFPEIRELDINPFVIDHQGEIVLDAKVILDDTVINKSVKPYSHMVISPYPREYESTVQIASGKTVLLRPIRPEDEPLEREMFTTFSRETQRYRFFAPVKEITHEMLIRYTQIDYDREIAIIAELSEDGRKKMVGVARLVADPYNENAEYAVVLGDPWQKQGLGSMMTDYMIDIAKRRGIKKIIAFTLLDNEVMVKIFTKRNFTLKNEEDMYRAELNLQDTA